MMPTSASSAAEIDHAAAKEASEPTETVTISKKRMRELEHDSESCKRRMKTMGLVAEEYICPITTELPVDPVTAEDGRIYERSAIEEHIRVQGGDLKSPATKETMGPKLLPAVQARNSMRLLVESGAISGGLAKSWNERLQSEAKIRDTRKKAEHGHTDAMCDLGDWYYGGKNGHSLDYELAYQWFKRASDLDSIRGMAEEGSMLVYGLGVEQNVAYGISLTTRAAEAGSDLAAHDMGDFYYEGLHGFPVHSAKAKYWLRRVVDGNCGIKHLSKAGVKLAKKRLKRLP